MFKLSRMAIRVGMAVLMALAMILAGSYAPSQVLATGIAPSLGVAESFAVLGYSAVTNTGSSVIIGDLGIYSGTTSSVTGFPPGSYTGELHAADAVALQARNAVTAAYINLTNQQPVTQDLTGQNLGGLTLVPGIYKFDSSAKLTGQLTLDAKGSADSVFIFQIGSTLTTDSNSSVVVINAPPEGFCNKWWQVGTSATLGTYSSFQGNILASASITLTTGVILYGRALALNGAVTMDSNQITVPVCGAITPPTGTLEIFKFNDTNENGVQDGVEAGLPGWNFTVTGPSSPGTYSTDGSGLITISNLTAGDYTVNETVQPGWIVTTAISQTGTVPAGGGLRLNFGNRLLESPPSATNGTLEIFKFNDTNDDGIYEPWAPYNETPLQYWNFNVTGGPTPTSGPYSTNVTGLITISDLIPGDYTVNETGQPGWTPTTDNLQTGTVPAGGGKRLNFGNRNQLLSPPVPPGTLQIFKFNDLNGNGFYDPGMGETPVANWEFHIIGTSYNETANMTDVNGLITISNLTAGAYNVTEMMRAGWAVTTDNPQTGTVSDDSGKRLNFGNRQPAILHIFKFNDRNGNGVYDPSAGETPLANWNYTITGPGGYSSSGYTDGLGLVNKIGLVPGNYTVTETRQAGWDVTTDNPQTVTVPAGGGETLNFGNKQIPALVPASSNVGTGIMIGVFGALLVWWTVRRYQHQRG